MLANKDFTSLKRYLERQAAGDVAWFWEDDSGYHEWIAKNQHGYVFNVVKDGNLVLHRATCGTIADAKAHFGIKVCALDRARLESLCRAAIDKDARPCRVCFARSDSRGNGSTRNLHIPLSPQVYSLLRDEASRAKRPATVLARQAIEDWLRQRRRAEIHEGIARYVAEMAGTGVDLDPALEAASLEHLADSEQRP